MADWIRPLFHAAGVSRDWHARKSGNYSNVTLCGSTVGGPLEVTQPDRAEREGQCPTCADLLAPAAMKPATPKAAAVAKAAPGRSDPPKRSRHQPKRGRG